MSGRSIGEALGELRKEFPDISVSKIRFLESQGLVTPSRTASGYRQFSDEDVDRLRWILTQQREHYLPLKVIRRKLREGGTPWAEPALDDPLSDAGLDEETASSGEGFVEAEAAPVPEVARTEPKQDGLTPPAETRVYSRTELAAAAGLDEKELATLDSFGLLPSTLDGDALTIARVAARFFAYGVEARHLRMYKSFAEREAGFLSQVVQPMSGPRGEGAAEARNALGELAALGADLRAAMLRVALGAQP